MGTEGLKIEGTLQFLEAEEERALNGQWWHCALQPVPPVSALSLFSINCFILPMAQRHGDPCGRADCSVPVLGAPSTVKENEEAFNQFEDMLPSLSMEYS